MGLRFAENSAPTQADALRAILMAWIVTLPAAGILSATASFLIQNYYL
jgi:phosphate/sulfate permease